MQQVLVKFEDVDQVRDFVNTVSTVDANFELGSGSRVVDAKSILGVLEGIGPFLVRERVG